MKGFAFASLLLFEYEIIFEATQMSLHVLKLVMMGLEGLHSKQGNVYPGIQKTHFHFSFLTAAK